ncbi:hypothetical protein [Arthrobacter sp. efr-133-TYG-120]|nr:hypothetical protein [Arthrobacter sp. efr-133-TYG-120]
MNPTTTTAGYSPDRELPGTAPDTLMAAMAAIIEATKWHHLDIAGGEVL